MAQALLSEDSWSFVTAHLPPHRRSPKGGRPRINDCATLTGILLVLKTGMPWGYLPRELGCGRGMTCWRRLHEWMQAGVWQRIHEAVLRRLREHIALGCADEASQHASRDPAWSPMKGSADGVGPLSAPWDGYIDFADCASGTSDQQTSIKRSFRLPARSSVGGMPTGFVRRPWPNDSAERLSRSPCHPGHGA